MKPMTVHTEWRAKFPECLWAMWP